MTPIRPALGALGAALAVASCGPKPAPLKDGAYLRSADEVGANHLPSVSGQLLLDGMRMPVQVTGRRFGDDLTIECHRHGQVVDREVYAIAEDSFGLKEAAGETYAPPIPLLTFPMNAGDVWNWTGTSRSGSEKRTAKALVETESAKVAEKGGNVPAIKATVNLELQLDGGPVQRRLSFWFAEGRGVVRREFGNESVREPGSDD